VAAQCDTLVQALLERKQDLLDFIKMEKEEKLMALKEQVASCTCKLQQTTGLLQFCIEALKETDPVAFLQVGSTYLLFVPQYRFTCLGRVFLIFKGSLHRYEYRNFCVNVYTCISVVRPLIDVNLGLN